MENVSTVQIKPETSWVFLMHRNNFLSPSLSTSYNMEGMISRCYQSGCVHLSYCLPTSSFLSIFWPFCFPLLTIYCGCRWISFPNSSLVPFKPGTMHYTWQGRGLHHSPPHWLFRYPPDPWWAQENTQHPCGLTTLRSPSPEAEHLLACSTGYEGPWALNYCFFHKR